MNGITGRENRMQSSIMRKVKIFLCLAISAMALVTAKAEALTISVSTPNIVNGVAVDGWSSVNSGNRAHVVYSTVSSTNYSVIYGSQTATGSYTFTTVSTGALANKPKYLTLIVNPTDSSAHTYYYDASSNTINYLAGTGLQGPQFPLGTGKVTASGLAADQSGTGFILLFSSSAQNSRYTLTSASFAFATANAVTSVTTVVSTSAGSVETGVFAAYTNTSDGKRGVIYFDNAASALKHVKILAGVVEDTREVLDTGSSISNIYVTDGSNQTAVTYTHSTIVKQAVQRRLISPSCWYIQKVDDGTSMNFISNTILYLKNGNLWAAFGTSGTFFDDFQESIVSQQKGLAGLVSSVTKAWLHTTSALGVYPLLVYQPSATTGGLATANVLTLQGTVLSSLGTAVSGTTIRANVTGGVDGGANDLNPATAGTQGGITNTSGSYQILVGSGTTMAVSASSTNWVFLWRSSSGLTTISTSATGSFSSGITGADFIAVSTPIIFSLEPSSMSVLYDAGPQSFTINAISTDSILSNLFAAGANARLVLQSAQGSIATSISSSVSPTATQEAGSIILNSQTSGGTSFAASSNTIWDRFSSSSAEVGSGKWYTLVVTTVTAAGHVMQAKKADMFQLKGMGIAVASGAIPTISLPGITTAISTGQINSSPELRLIVRSTGAYMFSDAAVQRIYLTKITSAIPPNNQNFGEDFKFKHGLVSTDTYNGGSNFFLTTGTIFGADYNSSYYIRIGSAPLNSQARGNEALHFVYSNAITISSPAITRVWIDNDSSTASIVTSTSIIMHLEGRGFVAGSSVTISTTNGTAANYAANAEFPLSYNGDVVLTRVNSSTSADILINSFSSQFALGTTLCIQISSAHVAAANVGLVDEFGLRGSTWVARMLGAISIGSAAITGVSPSTGIMNTRSYTISIYGRGLLGGSTLQLLAVDGSSAPPVVTAGSVSNGTSTLLTATVDFRSEAFAGKTYRIRLSSTATDAANATLMSIETPALIYVSSLTLSGFSYPYISTAGVYNSTGQVNIGLNAVSGLVAGAICNIPTLASPSVSSAALSGVSSSGAFAVFSSTAFFNRSAGTYNLIVTTTINRLGNHTETYVAAATVAITVLAASFNTVTVNDSSNYRGLNFATFTIATPGLQSGATIGLQVGTNNNGKLVIMGQNISRNTIDNSTATVSFDLRGATDTGNWTMFITTGCGQCSQAYTTLSKDVTISTPSVTGLSAEKKSNVSGGATLTVYGNGLTNGATVGFRYTDTAVTELLGSNIASSATVNATLTVSGNSVMQTTSGTFTMPSNMMPGSWKVTVTTIMAAGQYYEGNVNKAIDRAIYVTDDSTFSFVVTESSAPNAPTGLTVLSSGQKTVTLQWISPGDSGTTGSLVSGAAWIVYYASASNTRWSGCPGCFPIQAAQDGAGSNYLLAAASNYSFANTWAQFLKIDYADTAVTTNTSVTATAYSFSTSTAKGLIVTTQTIAITSTIIPGTTISQTLSIDPGTADGTFWFIVRAMDESGNMSPTNIVYSTVSAVITYANNSVATLSGGSATIDPNSNNTVTYSVETAVGGVTVKETNIVTPAGALSGTDSFNNPTINSSPSSDSTGVEGVGPSLGITLASGNTEFKKPITLTIKVDETQIISKLAGRSLSRVKLAYYNGSKWVMVADSAMGSGGNVSGSVTHLTEFRVVIAVPPSNLTSAAVYPNPYRPTLTTHLNQGITFDNLPSNSSIQIYTIAGDLVKQLPDNGSAQATWNAKNENGQDAASGVYFVLIKGGGDTKTLKLAIQR